MSRLIVAKLGGSLLDLPDLRGRIGRWIETVDGRVLLVPGGGTGADVIRKLDETHGLGAEAAHWLALRVLAVNAQVVASLLKAPVVGSPGSSRLTTAVLDAHEFCLADEGRPGALPHTWDVTSDAIAARVAEVTDRRLVLLKSADRPARTPWPDAARAGLVDPTFPILVERARLEVDWVNLRAPPHARR